MKSTRRYRDEDQDEEETTNAHGFGADDDVLDDDEEIMGLEAHEPLAWADPRVQRRNRCLLMSLVGLFLVAGIYALKGQSSSTNQTSVQDTLPEEEKNVFSGDSKASSYGGGSSNLKVCDHSNHTEWLNARVTKADGVKYEIISQLGHDQQAFV